MFSLGDILWLYALIIIAGIFWYRQKATENARSIARRHCQSQELQLLDDTVALKKAGLHKTESGRWCFRCIYQFEFSSLGDDRYHGELVYECGQVASVTLDAHRIDSEGF